ALAGIPPRIEGLAVRLAACVGLLAGCLALTGCSMFGKKSAAPTSAGGRPSQDLALPNGTGPGTATASAPTAPTGPVATPTSGGTGILAGQTLDNYDRRPPPTYIQVAAAPEPNQPAAAPIEVAADSQGYFLIQGLQPGKHYQLIARAR